MKVSGDGWELYTGHASSVLAGLPAGSVQTIVTSPPYFGLRDYLGNPDQIGLEDHPSAYVAALVNVFRVAREVLRSDGTLWLVLGDSYATNPSWGRGSSSQLRGRKHDRPQVDHKHNRESMGLARKNLMMMPARVALALQEDGWILRNDIIWHKRNAMPESVQDRMSSRHEHVFLFSAKQRYYFDLDSIRQPHSPATLGLRNTNCSFRPCLMKSISVPSTSARLSAST